MTAQDWVFEDIQVDHVGFYVDDVAASATWLVEGYGFEVYAESVTDATAEARSVGLGREQIRLVLTEPLVGDHPAAAYVDRHGWGVADIALGVRDVPAAFERAVRRGARPVAPPARANGVTHATIMGFGDVAHTFVQRPAGVDGRELPGLTAITEVRPSWASGLLGVDHFAVCLEAGQLEPTVDFYCEVLDFNMIFTERIVVGSQAMNSKVVQSRSGAVTLTLIEPDVSLSPGQIDDFLKNHGGAGVQHIAFTATDVIGSVGAMRDHGVDFLRTPPAYYRLLGERINPIGHPVEQLRDLSVLVDEDHHGQLFQIFSRSVHPRRTFFFEVIERMGARTFGSSNIKALYEAVELQRQQDQAGG
ncbi:MULTISPECIES: 4-hydroxyphenylpyruvate dioxygenase [unclassified Micromonospora]|uniref:4-hydroxyphenylpyruvate dioxygenase n=1 Tax=unclassified Micromonospora TaxID=2617518 RepID=UPI003A87FB4F